MTSFFSSARAEYSRINAATLAWMVERPRLHGVYLNTKLNPLTFADYGADDGLRGPDFLYGWIQGRGLEALVTHASAFETENADLSFRLDSAARDLHAGLDQLVSGQEHAYFCYDRDLTPIRRQGDGWVVQAMPEHIHTYTDAFVAKGLVAAAARFELPGLQSHLAYFDSVIAAIENGGFQLDEHAPLGEEALAAQDDDFGPRMILLGAAGMLKRAGLAAHAAYGDRFIEHVISRHFDPESGLLRNVPGGDISNVGHGIEFAGFALDHLGGDAPRDMLGTLSRVLTASFGAGYSAPGIALTVSVSTGQRTSPYCPWWTLPETIRTAALLYELTGDDSARSVWRTAHDAFFEWYWRETPPVAYQCRTADGPIDYVPATPDLDPGYHTGLSLLAAIKATDRMSSIKEHD